MMGFRLQNYKKETENKTIRFPLELVEEIEDVIVGSSVSFSGFVIQACRYALDHLDPAIDRNDDKDQGSR